MKMIDSYLIISFYYLK